MTLIELNSAALTRTGDALRTGWLRRRWRGLMAVLFALVIVFGGFLPPQVGGKTSYAITQGVSMLPHFHAGDLVILRREPTYHVGEVAAYHNGQLGVVVMHRIVAIHDGHYVFKGDNNDFIDTYEPTRAAIVGAEWAHLPGLGRYLLGLRDPFLAAVLLALLWLYSFAPPRRSRRQRRRHRHVR